MEKNNKIINESLSDIMGNCFARYAKYIIQDRAIPDARDGLKPVQRRILYAMYELGLTYDKPYKKSARTVGEVIGKYHPHGDSSIYESMVRMSQSWKNNLPLLDMHGNNGSIDGDSPAAMRYTECRLSNVTDLMLSNIKKNTVDFSLNFDDSEHEPTILPSLLPNLLINGSVGIAAGYATNIPPHNPTEVFNAAIYLIDHPNANLEQIMKIIPAPDFPTGGIIEGIDGVIESFKTGRGKFTLSSKLMINNDNKKYNQLIITEIPYDVNKSTIIKEINDIIFDEKIGGIIEVRDESDKNGINIVIDVKKDKNIVAISNYLFKNTHLQISYSTNFVAIVDRKPVVLDIIFALKHYLTHALDIQKKMFIFDLEKLEKRLEIVNGLIIAINNIDVVISIIRKSESKEDARQSLINKFNFTYNQAEAILVLRLYRLSKTDIGTLLEEADDLNQRINWLKTILNDEKLQHQHLKKTLYEFRDLYGYKRKTKIINVANKIEVNEHEIMDIKEQFIFVTIDGYIKKVSNKMYESNEIATIGFKPLDFVFFGKKCLSNEYLLLITKYGKSICLPIFKLNNFKWKDLGDHINSYVTIDSNDKIIFADIINNDCIDNYSMIFFTKYGYSKKTLYSEFINLKLAKSINVYKLKPNDELVSVHSIKNNSNYFISLINNNGNGFAFSSCEIPLLGKNTSGVKIIKLKPSEYLVKANITKSLLPYCLFILSSGIRLIPLKEFKVINKNNAGRNIIHIKNGTNDKLLDMIIVNKNSSINILNTNNEFFKYSIEKVGINKFIKFDENILYATYNLLDSGPIIENITNDTLLPKNNIEDNEQLKLLDE